MLANKNKYFKRLIEQILKGCVPVYNNIDISEKVLEEQQIVTTGSRNFCNFAII